MLPSKNTEKIQEIFLSLKPYLKMDTNHSGVICVNSSYGIWSISEEGRKQYEKLVEMLSNADGLCESDVSNIITDYIGKLLYNSDMATIDCLRNKLQELEKDIREREICLAVYGLEIESGLSFNLGKITFHSKDLEKLAPKGPESSQNVEYGWGCLHLTGTQLYMQDIAQPVLSEHILVLEYLYNFFETDYPQDLIADFSLKWTPKNNSESMEISRIKGQPGFDRSSDIDHNHVTSVKISKSQIDKWKQTSLFKKLDGLLLENDGKIRRRVMTAISFLHDAENELRVDLRILKSVIGVEALLGTPNDNHLGKIAVSLAEKVAFLLDSDLEKRMQTVKYIKELYGLRSGVGHGRGCGSDMDSIFYADFVSGQYLIAVINAFLNLYNEEDGFHTLDEFDNWYAKKKMS